MNALKVKNPITESFLVQLDVDLEGSGLVDGDDGISLYSRGTSQHVWLPFLDLTYSIDSLTLKIRMSQSIFSTQSWLGTVLTVLRKVSARVPRYHPLPSPLA